MKQWNEELERQLKPVEENGSLVFKDEAMLQNRQEFLDTCISGVMRQLSETGVAVDEELLTGAATSSLDSAYLGDVLDLSKRAYNCLRHADINTMGKLLSRKASELLQIRNLGHGMLNEIVLELGKHGLELMEEEDLETQARIDKILLSARRQLTKVEKLELKAGTYNLIKSLGCNSVEDVYRRCSIPRCDVDTVFELRECLSALGFPRLPWVKYGPSGMLGSIFDSL